MRNQGNPPRGVPSKTSETRSVSSPVSLPSLDEIAVDFKMFDDLPGETQNLVYAEVATLEARLRARLLGRRQAEPPQSTFPDRAISIVEASSLLGMSKDFLFRNWQRLGAYKDDDRRVKFPLSTIRRHIERKARRT